MPVAAGTPATARPPRVAADAPAPAVPARTLLHLRTLDAVPPAAFELAGSDPQAAARRTPMQQMIWARAAADVLSPGVPVRVVTVGPDDRPLALAPLSVARGPRRLQLLGAEELAEPVEVAYRSAADLDALARALAATGMPLRFGHYLADTPFLAALRRAYRGKGLVVARPLPVRACPSIALDPSWVEPERHFPAGRRSDFRRMQRTAAKAGTVSFEIHAPSGTAVPALLAEAIDVEARSWKGRAGTALVNDDRQRRFYERYADLAATAGILRILFLRIGGTAVAAQIAAETEGRFWLFKIGYDEAFARCSPGNLLMRESIRHAAGRGLRSFEFLGKEAAWTRLWTDTARPVVALRTYPFNPSGAIALAADAAVEAGKRIERARSGLVARWHRPSRLDAREADLDA